MQFSPKFQGLFLDSCALIKNNFPFTTVNIVEIDRELKKLVIFKMAEMSKNEKNSLRGSLHVFDHKKRTNNNWNAVEPILELENIDPARKMVVVAHSVEFSNPDPHFYHFYHFLSLKMI